MVILKNHHPLRNGLLTGAALCLVAVLCSIPRDNPLDTQNPDYVPPQILIDTTASTVHQGDTFTVNSFVVVYSGNFPQSLLAVQLDAGLWSEWSQTDTFSASGLANGSHVVRIRSFYNTGAGDTTSDSIAFFVLVADTVPIDTIKPTIRLFDPPLDSTTISANTKLVKVIATDANGIRSVRYTVNADTFPATKTDSVWSANVLNLRVGYNTITITVTDSSANRNVGIRQLRIKYDSTLVDTSHLTRPTNLRVSRMDTTRVRIAWSPAHKAVKYQVWSNPDRNVQGYSMSAEVTDTFAVHTTRFDYWYYVIAFDAVGNKAFSTDTVRVDPTAGDTTGPTIRLATPSLAGSRISASSKRIDAIITDKNGVSSVRFAVGSDTFPVTKADDSTYYATVAGLSNNTVTTITITAVDGATARNQRVFSFSLTYDATLADAESPTFVQKSGATNLQRVKTAIGSLVFTIQDPSGLDTVYYTVNGVYAGTGTKTTTNDYQFNYNFAANYGRNRIAIHAVDNSANHNADSVIITLNHNTPISAPVAVSPANQAADVAVPTVFTWTGGNDPDGDTVRFKLRYGLTSAGLTAAVNAGTARTTTLSNLVGNREYTWQVTAYSDSFPEDSISSQVMTFVTRNNPPQVTLSAPANRSTGITGNVTFVYGATLGDDDPVQYEIWLGTDSNLTATNRVASNLTVTTFTYTTALTRATRYFWRVVATETAGVARAKDTSDAYSFWTQNDAPVWATIAQAATVGTEQTPVINRTLSPKDRPMPTAFMICQETCLSGVTTSMLRSIAPPT